MYDRSFVLSFKVTIRNQTHKYELQSVSLVSTKIFFSQFYERTNSIGGLCIEHAELISLITYLSFDLLSHSGPVNPLSQTHLYPAGSGIHFPPLKQRWSLGQTGPLAEGEKIKKIGHFDIYSYSESINRF